MSDIEISVKFHISTKTVDAQIKKALKLISSSLDPVNGFEPLLLLVVIDAILK